MIIKMFDIFIGWIMDGSNGNDGDGNPSPIPHNPERIAILDAGAQYGKVNKCLNKYSPLMLN